jgi:PAS domain S-box-containing protein
MVQPGRETRDQPLSRDHESAGQESAELHLVNDARFAVAVESMIDEFTLFSPIRDRDGKIVDFRCAYANQAASRMGGGRALIGRRLGELTPGFTATRRFDVFRRAMTGTETGRIEEVIPVAAPGQAWLTPRRIEFSVVGERDLLAVTARDITDLHDLQAELKLTAERFEAAVGSMQDLFAIFSAIRDDRGEIIDLAFDYVNPAYCSAVGRDRDALTGARLGVVFPGFLDSQRFGTYRDAIRSGEPVRSEYFSGASLWEGTNLSGRVLDLVVVANDDTLVLSGRDITDQIHAERELALRGELLDLAHDAVIVRDPMDSTVTFWNREAEAIYGYTATQAVGKITHELLATVFPESLNAMQAALDRDGLWAGVLRHTRHDGEHIIVSSRQALQRDGDGRPTAIIELNSDITERRNAEMRVAELNAQLETANRELATWTDAVGRLAGGVAHELNNKLTVIMGYTDGVSKKLDSANPLQSQLSEVRTAAEHSAALTRDLLAFAQRQMLNPQAVIASQIADGLSRMLRPALGDAIKLVITDRSNAAVVYADLTQIQHAVLYLALNGCDAMPDGGSAHDQHRHRPTPHSRRDPCTDRSHLGLRHRDRNTSRHPQPHLRAVLHHQGNRPRPRPRPLRRSRHHRADRRNHQRALRARTRKHIHHRTAVERHAGW